MAQVHGIALATFESNDALKWARGVSEMRPSREGTLA